MSRCETLLRDATDPDVVQELRSVSTEIKRLLKKDALCQCDCPDCVAGNCADCSDSDCVDANCEGSVQAAQDAEELAALKAFALELKKLTV
jgi:hypothetical protein